MVADASTPASTSLIFTVVIIAAIAAFRFRRIRNGTKVNRARTILIIAILAAVASFFVGGSFLSIGIPTLFFIPYIGVAIPSGYAGFRYSKKSVKFWKGEDGSIYSKGGLPLFAIYIATLIARISIGVLVGGSVTTFSTRMSAVSTISPAAYWAAITTDFLMMFGAGLFIGMNIQILKRYSLIKQGMESLSEG